jgi:phospholipid/cholesterol/gamma-HCH transport system substrate-binding protein
MLTRFVKRQLVLFTILTVVTCGALGGTTCVFPLLAGVGQYS